jgi:hypothetical protein
MRVPWEKIEQHFGSVEAYVKAFGVADGTLEQLRGALLE